MSSLSAHPELRIIIEAARADPSTLPAALADLARTAPELLQQVQQRQAEFLALLNTATAEPLSDPPTAAEAPAKPETAAEAPAKPGTAAEAPAKPGTAAEAPAAPVAAPAPLEDAPALCITLVHKDAKHQIEIDVTDSVEVLRFQVFSLTEVPPEEQQITGLGPGILRDDAELESLGIAPGTWAMLVRKPAAAAAAAAPAPGGAAAGCPRNAGSPRAHAAPTRSGCACGDM